MRFAVIYLLWTFISIFSMNTALKSIFTDKIRTSTGFDFEDFVNDLFLLRYGHKDFTPIRRNKDKGSDGIIEISRTIVACYGPQKYDEKKFKKKATDDFSSYQDHWESKYENWLMVVNHDIAPDQKKIMNSLKNDSTILGLRGLINLIETELNSFQRREIGQSTLQIPALYFAQDYLEEILGDLLNTSLPIGKNLKYIKKDVVEVEKKIKINYDPDDVAGALDEYTLISLEFHKIDKLISSYEDEEILRIKHTILSDHNKFGGSFKAKLEHQTETYLERYSGSKINNDYSYYIRAILVYHFEQCFLGKKVT